MEFCFTYTNCTFLILSIFRTKKWEHTSTLRSSLKRNSLIYCGSYSVCDAGNIVNLMPSTEHPDQCAPTKRVAWDTGLSKVMLSTVYVWGVEDASAQYLRVQPTENQPTRESTNWNFRGACDLWLRLVVLCLLIPSFLNYSFSLVDKTTCNPLSMQDDCHNWT